MKRILVIGGGISGLAAVYKLLADRENSERQLNVTLLESGMRAGGIVHTAEREGFLLERGPDSFICEKPHALELAHGLGLGSNLIPTNPNHRRSFVVHKGKLLSVPNGFHLLAPALLRPFLTSGIFSWRGKARMTMDLLLPRRTGTYDDESLADFVRRRLGREALERMAQPMVGGIYTADPETLSLRATMPRFWEMEQRHRSLILALRRRLRNTTEEGGPTTAIDEDANTSGARYSLFVSFDRGMQLLTDALAKRISTLADQAGIAQAIRLNTRVESLELMRDDLGARWQVVTDTKETFVADAVCLALPAYGAARLLQKIDPNLSSILHGITYASSATINLAYKTIDVPHPLDGFGFVVPFLEDRSIMACSFSSVKFVGRAPAGHVLLRVFMGGALQPEILAFTDDELVARARVDLADLMGIGRGPLFTQVSRWNDAMPQYQLGHLRKVRQIRQLVASLPGMAVAGNAYDGPGIPDCIRSGQEAAESLSVYCSNPSGIDSRA